MSKPERSEPTAPAVGFPVERMEPGRGGQQHYADVPPAGYALIDEDEPAKAGDLAYRGVIGGRWVRVRPGQNIVGATQRELDNCTSVLALARSTTPNV